jgi:hypothetical protein
MRSLFFIVCATFVIGLAYWAYTENYKTQGALKEVRALQKQIAREKETIAVLKVEWAYLNRPDRLRDLVDLNFEDLKLIPLLPSHFGDSGMVEYPTTIIDSVTEPVTIRGGTQP